MNAVQIRSRLRDINTYESYQSQGKNCWKILHIQISFCLHFYLMLAKIVWQ